MTVPLSKDATAQILGVDLAHRGLYCRFRGCREHFDPLRSNSEADLALAAAKRNVHEVAEHGYQHVRMGDGPWAFTQRFSRGGRSTLKEVKHG